MPLIFQKRYYTEDLANNKNVLYLFGDNEIRKGTGGQAKVCRGQPNAIGIATKRFPSMDENAFWSDSDYERCVAIIDNDFKKVFAHLEQGGVVVCPSDGLGTDRAQLKTRAPKVLNYIRSKIKDMLVYNKTSQRNSV